MVGAILPLSLSPNASIDVHENTPFMSLATLVNETQTVDSVYPTVNGRLWYDGTPNYNNITNIRTFNDGSYVHIEEITKVHTSHYDFLFKQNFLTLTTLYIQIYARQGNAEAVDTLEIRNWTSGTQITIASNVITSSSYHWSNFSYPISFNSGEIQSTATGLRVRLSLIELATAIWGSSWQIDYIQCNLMGTFDVTPPNIHRFTKSPVTDITSADAIWFNSTITDNLTVSANLTFNGDINLASNMTFDIDMPSTIGDDFALQTKLPAGKWTVTLNAADTNGNVNSSQLYFEVSQYMIVTGPISFPMIVLYPNVTRALVNQTIQLTIEVHNGTEPLEDLWIYDGVTASNVTIEENINQRIDLTRTYNVSTSNDGSYTFTAYVNASPVQSSNTITLTFVNETITYSPPIVYMYPNATQNFIDETCQFTIQIMNGSDTTSTVWMYDGILSQNITIATNIDDLLDHSYTYNATTSLVGTYDFIVYCNDSTGNTVRHAILDTVTFNDPITISTLYAQPTVFMYSNTTLANIYATINFTIYAINGTESIDSLWLYDPIIDQNISIATIHGRGTYIYSYPTTSTVPGQFVFTAYCNDSTQTVSFTFIPISFAIPPNNLNFQSVWANDTFVGIEHGTQISFIVFSIDYLIDSIWIYDPILDQNISIVSEFEGYYSGLLTYNASSNEPGSILFYIYANATLGGYNLETEETFLVVWTVLEITPDFTSLIVSETPIEISKTITITWTVKSTEYALDSTWVLDGVLGINKTYTLLNGTGSFIGNVSTVSNMPGTFVFTIYANDTHGNIAVLETELVWFIPNYTLTLSVRSRGGFPIENAIVTLNGLQWGAVYNLTTDASGIIQVSLFNDTYLYTIEALGHIGVLNVIYIDKDTLLQLTLDIVLGFYALSISTLTNFGSPIAGSTITITNDTDTFTLITDYTGSAIILLLEGNYSVTIRAEPLYAPVSDTINLTIDTSRSYNLLRSFFGLSTLRGGEVTWFDFSPLLAAMGVFIIYFEYIRRKYKHSIALAGVVMVLTTYATQGFAFFVPIGLWMFVSMFPFIIADDLFHLPASYDLSYVRSDALEEVIATFGIATIVAIVFSDAALYASGFGHILPDWLQPASVFIFGTIIGVASVVAFIMIGDVLVRRIKIVQTHRLEELLNYILLISSTSVLLVFIIFRFINLSAVIEPLIINIALIFFCISSGFMIYRRIQTKLLDYWYLEIVFALLGAGVLTFFFYGVIFLW
jgi:hypothetical protein